jgi:hypothetical protein
MSDQTPTDPYGTPGQQQPPAPPPQPGYAPPYGQGYGQGYGQPGYGQPGYAAPQYGQPGYYPPPPPPTPGRATTALVLGIAGLLLCPLVLSIPAIFLGRSAVKEIDASQGTLGGRSSATAGFVLGIIGTVWGLLLIGFFVLFFATVGAADCHGTSTQTNFSIHCS